MSPRVTRAQEEQPRLIIGIDFGTTYSGLAFAHSGNANKIEIVSNWLEGKNTDKGKCPTLSVYEDSQMVHWGYDCSKDHGAIKWFKLLLLHAADLPTSVRDSDELIESRNRAIALNKLPADLVADYLREIWKLAMIKVNKIWGEEIVDNSQFHVVLSVPAIWPDYAKENMRDAARWAGICDDRPGRPAGETMLDLTSEPEAAALATMADHFGGMFDVNGEPIAKDGDCFVVCDCGGGTVDLITYKVVSVKPWRIEECVRGDGKLCGAVILDKGFRRVLKSKVSPEHWELIKDNPYIFETQWEKTIKREYRAGSNEEAEIHIPVAGAEGLVKLTKEDMQSIFDPVIKNIIDLVKKQIAGIKKHKKYKGPLAKYVVLVGGLGSSQHLYECLQNALAAPNGPEILQSEGSSPWTAISRGAVLQGFNLQSLRGHAVPGAPKNNVASRIARRSYGVVCTFDEWDPKKHSLEDRRYCPVEDCYVADYQMSWFVEVGEPLKERVIKLKDFSQLFETPDDMPEVITTELNYSDALKTPDRCDDTVKVHCVIRWTRVPDFYSLPERLTDAGKEVRELSYDIEMVFEGTSAYFSV